MINNIFENLFVLELSNNHWGSVERGLKLVSDYSKIVRFNNVKAAIKLQFRDIDSFIHKDFKNRTDIKYINKIIDTQLSYSDYNTLIKAIKKSGCITMSTPFDKKSVSMCVKLGIQIIKIASSDLNNKVLVEEIAKTKKPVIVSTGGSLLKDIDEIVTFFENKNIPLAINHCVSVYPCGEDGLELNQIDFLKSRYPNHIIGFSTHEYNDSLENSMFLAYAKGARTFERHIDMEWGGIIPVKYCSSPQQIDMWFKAFNKAKLICGSSGVQKRATSANEKDHLKTLVRGVYAKKDLSEGHILSDDDIYLAIPLQEEQISCRELMMGEVLLKSCKKDAPVMISSIDAPCLYNN